MHLIEFKYATTETTVETDHTNFIMMDFTDMSTYIFEYINRQVNYSYDTGNNLTYSLIKMTDRLDPTKIYYILPKVFEQQIALKNPRNNYYESNINLREKAYNHSGRQ